MKRDAPPPAGAWPRVRPRRLISKKAQKEVTRLSCSSLRQVFEREKNDDLTFKRAMEIYEEAKGSVAAHRTELAELEQKNPDPERVSHLRAHIQDGEKLLAEIESLRWR